MKITHHSPDRGKRIREWVDSVPYKWNNVPFQIDEASQQRIAARALQIMREDSQGKIPRDVRWRDANNDTYTFTPTEFLEFFDDIETFIEDRLLEAWAVS